MYAIIYWQGDDEVYPLMTEDLQLKLFTTLKEADKRAEKEEKEHKDIECRVISIQGVNE